MKCKNCGSENLMCARYCENCGHPFTEEEREEAYGRTFFGKLDGIKKLKSFVTLEFITSNPIFRAAFLVLLVFIGIRTGTNRGSEIRPLESESYTVGYNKETDEYYLFTDLDEVDVSLYLPGKPQGIRVSADREDANIYTKEYATDEVPVLVRDPSVVYTVYGIYEKGEDSITVLLYDSSVREDLEP